MKYMKINGRTTTPSIRSEKISFRNSFLSVKIRDCLCLVREDARQRFQRLFLRIKFYADTFLPATTYFVNEQCCKNNENFLTFQ